MESTFEESIQRGRSAMAQGRPWSMCEKPSTNNFENHGVGVIVLLLVLVLVLILFLVLVLVALALVLFDVCPGVISKHVVARWDGWTFARPFEIRKICRLKLWWWTAQALCKEPYENNLSMQNQVWSVGTSVLQTKGYGWKIGNLKHPYSRRNNERSLQFAYSKVMAKPKPKGLPSRLLRPLLRCPSLQLSEPLLADTWGSKAG